MMNRSPAARVVAALALLTLGCQDGETPFDPPEAARFEAALDQMHEEQQAVGSLLAFDDGTHVFRGARGAADLAAGRAMTVDTPYRTASIAKTFTGALILSLHEEGTLSVEDPVSRFVDWVPNGENITLRMLLTHTSGLRNYTYATGYLPLIEANGGDVTYEEMVRVALEDGPEFEPGTDWGYCNTGYLLLAHIAEQLTGRTLYEEVRDRFFVPLGITRTRPIDLRDVDPELARSYVVGEDGPIQVAGQVWTLHPADGGWMTTLEEMAIWARHFLGGRLHSAETLALARHPEGGPFLDSVAQSFGLEAGGYALGFIEASDATLGPLYAGAGNGDGTRSFVGYLPEHDIAFALFVDVGDSRVPIVETLSAAGPALAALRAHVNAP
ncbi:MAG: beta-lactamase family protein [Myxococcales bacterium]|nr:beta-lactamase family protein [Myxococcales bacterium]